jgi:hypothetical protein
VRGSLRRLVHQDLARIDKRELGPAAKSNPMFEVSKEGHRRRQEGGMA